MIKESNQEELSNQDEYIRLTDLNISRDTDKNEDKHEYKAIYQLQSTCDENKLIEVGIFNSTPSVLLQDFDISENLKCLLLSCFHDQETIKNSKEFTIMKILINRKSDRLHPIASLSYNFNLSEELENAALLDLLGKNIKGYFTINFHYKEKYMNILRLEKFVSRDYVMEEMISKLLDEPIQSILNELLLE